METDGILPHWKNEKGMNGKLWISAIQYLTMQLRISSVTVEPEVISTANSFLDSLFEWTVKFSYIFFIIILYFLYIYIVIQYFPK